MIVLERRPRRVRAPQLAAGLLRHLDVGAIHGASCERAVSGGGIAPAAPRFTNRVRS
jgi:hypothetical protein